MREKKEGGREGEIEKTPKNSNKSTKTYLEKLRE